MNIRWGRTFSVACALAVVTGLVWAPRAGAAPILIGFSEAIDNSLTHTTDQVHSSDRGIVPLEFFEVDKFIHNISDVAWTGLQIDLLALADGVFVPSTHDDGVSFDEIEDLNTWLANVTVDINGVDKGPIGTNWTVTRAAVPADQIDFTFLNFVVNPDDTLSLHFRMSDNNDNTWELRQTAVPEPATLLLLSSGVLAYGWRSKKRTNA